MAEADDFDLGLFADLLGRVFAERRSETLGHLAREYLHERSQRTAASALLAAAQGFSFHQLHLLVQHGDDVFPGGARHGLDVLVGHELEQVVEEL